MVRRLGATGITALITFIAVFVLTTALVVAVSLEKGLELSRERLGADIMVLPTAAAGNASEVLFCAEPVNVYLPATQEEAVSQIEGVAAVTPQFFTQTVNQSCCSVIGVTRVVGVDMTSDFILRPWMASAEFEGDGLPSDGILLGAAAPPIEGGQASILGSVFRCVGVLEPTGTSVDETIFMDIGTARLIAGESPYLERVWAGANPADSVSCFMVKVSPGSEPAEVAAAIAEHVPGSAAVCTSDLVSGVTTQLAVLESVTLAFSVAVALLAALALAGRFTSLASARMRELGLLRTLGVSRFKVAATFVGEVGAVALAASLVAALGACATASVIVGRLHDAFDVPGLLLPGETYGWAIAGALVFALILSAVALVQPIISLARRDPQETLAQGGM